MSTEISPDHLIGDATKEKWLAFLSQAMVQGFIDADELVRRSEITMTARTWEELHSAHSGFEEYLTDHWNTEWAKLRRKGLAAPYSISPEMKTPRQVIRPMTVLAIAGWLAFILIAVMCVTT